MDSSTNVERQLYILSLLSQSIKGYTLVEIIDNLQRVGVDATRRMVARDMDSISRNFYVYEDDIEGKTVYKADKYAMSDMDFTMPQVIALYYIKEMLRANRSLNLAKEASDIVDKILAQMPELSKTALHDIENMIKIVPMASSGETNVDEAMLESVRAAVQTCSSIEVLYTTFSTGETQSRVFDPYVLEVRDGCWHVIGYCHLRKSVRDLRISRIQDVKKAAGDFQVPAGFYEQYKRTRFDKLAGEKAYDICIEFSGAAARLVAEYHKDKADSIRQQNDTILFCKKAALTPDLVSWLMSFGAQARVIAPEALADAIVCEAEKTVELYERNAK